MEKPPEIIPVGTGRDDVKVLLVVFSGTETVISVVIIANAGTEAKARAEEVKNQEMLILRKNGYELAGRPMQFRKKVRGKTLIITRYVFRWTDWKYETMHMEA